MEDGDVLRIPLSCLGHDQSCICLIRFWPLHVVGLSLGQSSIQPDQNLTIACCWSKSWSELYVVWPKPDHYMLLVWVLVRAQNSLTKTWPWHVAGLSLGQSSKQPDQNLTMACCWSESWSELHIAWLKLDYVILLVTTTYYCYSVIIVVVVVIVVAITYIT